MTRLLKYEFRKTLFTKLVLLGLTAVIEAWYLVSLWKNRPDSEGVALVLLGLFGILFMGIQSVLTLHRDMNTRQSYMLFMTPNSTYRILGAKVLESGLSTLLAGAFFFGVVFADVTALMARNQSVEETLSMLRDFLSAINENIRLNLGDILCYTAYVLASWLSTVFLAYLADIVSSSLLNGKRFGLLISFLVFLLLNYLVFKGIGALPGATDPRMNQLLQSGYCLLASAIVYYVSAKLMDRYLSV